MNVNFKVDRELWKKFKIKAIKDNCTSAVAKLRELIKEYTNK